MNYFKEINAFYDWLETHPQDKAALSLWHALMHTNNKCRWISNFSVPMSLLLSKSGLGKKEFLKARKALVNSGRITLLDHSKKEAAKYCINSFFDENENLIFPEQGVIHNLEIIKEDSTIINPNEKVPKLYEKLYKKTSQAINQLKNKDISNSSDENVSQNSKADINFNKSTEEENPQKTEEFCQNKVLFREPNNSNFGTSKSTYKNKVNVTKHNLTINKNLEEDKSSSSECVSKKVDVNLFFDEYNRVCTRLPKAKTLSKRRKQALLARAEEHGEAAVHEVIKLAAESNFLNGDSKSGWCANFDWLFMPNNFLKILEGSYNNKPPNNEFGDYHGFNNRNHNEFIGKPSPFEILEQSFKDNFGDDNFRY